MISGWLLVGMGALVSVVDFLVGLYLARRTTDGFAPGFGGQPPRSAETLNRVGRLVMLTSPLPFLILTALAMGLFGPTDGIETISFN